MSKQATRGRMNNLPILEPSASAIAIAPIKLAIRVTAVYELRTYDVWGNDNDGYTVNDSFNAGIVDIPCCPTLLNAPIAPGASDRFRSFPCRPSLSVSDLVGMVIDYTPEDSDVARALGERPSSLDIEGYDRTIYVNRARDGKPLYELHLIGFRAPDGFIVGLDN